MPSIERQIVIHLAQVYDEQHQKESETGRHLPLRNSTAAGSAASPPLTTT